jgi:hypothetical protein
MAAMKEAEAMKEVAAADTIRPAMAAAITRQARVATFTIHPQQAAQIRATAPL